MTRKRSCRREIACLPLDGLCQLLADKKNGRPNYGAILQYHRLRRGWTAEKLAFLYSEALGFDEEEPVTPHWIYRMEKKNEVPVDEKRRWILARLLDIPPVLFALEEASLIPSVQWQAFFDNLHHGPIDLVEYRTALVDYCQSWSTREAMKRREAIPDLSRRIHVLEQKSHGVRGPQKQQMLRLLCEYYLLLASTAREMQQFDRSIALASWVITLAEMNKFYDLWAYALRQRGLTYEDRGELTVGLVNFAAARDDFEAAVHDFEAIKQIETHLSPQCRGLMWVSASQCYAYVAQDQASLSQALKLVDLGEKMIGEDSDDLAITVKFDQSRALLNRGSILIHSPIPALRSPAKACAAFEQAMQFTPPTNKRRHLEGSLRQAAAYFYEGSYEMAVAYAEQALELVRDTDVITEVAWLHNLYVRLRESPFGENGDVVRFGVDLLKVQKADLFH